MKRKNRFALKEWAIVLSALSQGRQILLLRKGGLSDHKNQFSLEHKEFFLFPTHLHQQRVEIERKKLEKVSSTGFLTLTTYATAKGNFWVTDPHLLKKLDPFHILPIEEARTRLQSGKIRGLQILLLRVYKLSNPIQTPMLPQFLGCKSWVDLGKEFPLPKCQPVLENSTFYHQIKQIKKICGQE